MVHADLEQVLIWRNHVNVRRYMYTQHEIKLNEHKSWFECAITDSKKHLLIFEENRQPMGYVNFNEAEKGGIMNWGFYVAPNAPKGSGRKLGCAALNHAFIKLKFHKVCGQTLYYNQRSIVLHQKLGFQQEGLLRNQHFDGNSYHNVIFFGLLSHEWKPSL